MSPSKVSTIEWDKFYNIVDGQNRLAKSVHNGVNPSTAEKLWDVPIATEQDLEDAIASARKVFPSWSQTPIDKRRELLKKYGETIMQYEEEFTTLLGKENGKPQLFANGEVKAMSLWLGWHLKLEIPEETFEDDDKVIKTRYMPLGVCGAICPWNYPLLLSLGKIVPAVLTGNTIIVKPSPFTPYTSLKLIELAQEVFPPGVVQVIGGNDKLGASMTTHPGIDKISFTGSIPTGKKVMEACAKTLKRVTLELGGNDATIILPDVDVEKVAPEVAMGAFQNSGQVCVATKRIYIHESIYQPFLDAMVRFTKSIKVGGYDEEGVLLGPIQNSMQYEKVKGYFNDTKVNGYKFAVGQPDVAAGKGFFVQPTIIDNPPEDSKIVQEEPFGPIVPAMPYSDLEDAIARANNTLTGLGATVWGKDVEAAEKVAFRLEAGSVWVNSYEKPTPQALFGGVKQSGLGGEWGKTGLLAYLNPHVIHVYKTK
ncbi:aldehyde dehydrogenase [Rhizodiscina lignyota]|uniref:aldehyde dehydrogenase (NAD(+)) n=1 Tax=Rhizodiscina lignyota TaxID=1504668 RepID=A0A9P4IJB7_9PEZI|nr:aldehyde dehydrogenase [Rhizodiscina lignyota]